MSRREVVRTYVEMRAPDALRAADRPEGAVVSPLTDDDAESYRFFYGEVGSAYHWRDRQDWTNAQIRAHLARADVEVRRLDVDGAPAGFYELVHHPDRSVEIAYFGLLASFHGRGLGRFLLTDAARHAWSSAPARVWLHTCTLDDPAALPNYLARGFVPYREERYDVLIEDA